MVISKDLINCLYGNSWDKLDDSYRWYTPCKGDLAFVLNPIHHPKMKEHIKVEAPENNKTHSHKKPNDIKESNNKERKMKKFKIKNYKEYGNKAIIIEFADGTETKAVCNEKDDYDFERGLEVCILKYIFGEDGYKALLKEAMNQIKEVDKAVEDEKEKNRIIAAKRAKKARKKAKKRQQRIDEMKEAYLNAMRQYNDEYFFNHCHDCDETFEAFEANVANEEN